MGAKKLLKYCACALIGGFSIGYGVTYVYAKIIPGVDEPYDPGAYYSETAISYADSAPSVFALRELSKGTVYDKTRHVKSILFKDDFMSWLDTLIARTGIMERNIKPQDKAVQQQTAADIQAVRQDAASLYRGGEYETLMRRQLFRSTNNYSKDESAYSKDVQHKALEEKYSTFAKAAEDAVKNTEADEVAYAQIMENVKNAQGEVEIEQAEAQLAALQEAELAKRNVLLSNLAELRAIQKQIEMDEHLAAIRATENAKLRVEDPYRETSRPDQAYDRPEGIGFVEFK